MKCNMKMFYPILLLFINIVFTGCINERRLNPPQVQNETGKNAKQQTQKTKKSEKALLDVPIISQKPELKSGCEVTSLAMLLQYAGIDVDKMTLAKKIKKDETPLVLDKEGNIIKWGDPNDGFVGDITGKNEGFAAYPKPLLELMEQYIPGKSVDLTGQPFESLLASIDRGRPVIAWVTIDFKRPGKYEKWKKDGKTIKATMDEHAVLLVGYDKDYCYINNPYNGKKNQKIRKSTFIDIWNIMGSMAVSYK